jgi:hypothetical protein
LFDDSENIWGLANIGRILYDHPSYQAKPESLARMVRRKKEKYRYSAEPIPIFREWVGSGKRGRWEYWSNKVLLEKWRAAVAWKGQHGGLWPVGE